jgi:hypothetical protein
MSIHVGIKDRGRVEAGGIMNSLGGKSKESQN